ncbi:unnamed protein product [Tuber aestivum]|uniref:Tyrosine specific protein phosphatases domain-containing protein n=1 Tax=Tuber aestivum TaxID=59557 RepID=A0A292PLJ2_9PEZI|nr:unnamed protein product [Tuber aestivum]
MNSNNRFGMRNGASGRLLGRNGHDELVCITTELLSYEWLTFRKLSAGGFLLMVESTGTIGKLYPIQRTDSNSPYLNIGEASNQFGLHKLTGSVFRRFEWVVPNRLARSSAPYYEGDDSDQGINETSIEFLVSRGIKNIISLNSIELSPRERDRLCAADISYSHVRSLEFTAPRQKQFDQIWKAYEKAGATIVYCGYGDGRTGMAISAIQLFEGRTLGDLDYRANGVQCPSQLAALNDLSERIHGQSDGLLNMQPPSYTAWHPRKGGDRMRGDEIVEER